MMAYTRADIAELSNEPAPVAEPPHAFRLSTLAFALVVGAALWVAIAWVTLYALGVGGDILALL